MKNYLLIINLISLALVSGCASNHDAMQAKVDALEAKSQAQEKQIADLKKQEGPTMQSVEDKAKAAWDWTSNEAQAAWNSDTATDARARLEKCYQDLKQRAAK